MFVVYLRIDFTKAFDVVDHDILAPKRCGLDIPPMILGWVFSFLSGRTQQVKCGFPLSFLKPVNKGIFQGSGLGATLYTVMESDLKPLTSINILYVFRWYYCNFLVWVNTDVVGTNDEFDSILK